MTDGFFPVKTVLNPDLGEEVVLYLRDQKPFMEELRLVRPFRLMLKAGAARNEFGPLCIMVFRTPSPADLNEAFAAYEVDLYPHSEVWLVTWRELAAQSHWNLFLIGTSGEQRDFLEIENTFSLDETLDLGVETCRPIQLMDFNRAQSQVHAGELPGRPVKNAMMPMQP